MLKSRDLGPHVNQPLTSQAYERVVLSAFHSMLVVEILWTSFLVEFIRRILKHGR